MDPSGGEATPKDVWTKVLDRTEPTTSNTKWDPYVLSDWVQNAAVIISAEDELEGYVIREGNITYDHNEETGMATARYKIRNDAGIELPSTGGPGTYGFYLIGIIITMLAAAALWVKKKQQML